MKNVPSAAAGTSSCLSDEQHEPPSIEVNVSIARLDSSGSAHCRLLFHICKRRLWSTTIKLSFFQSWIIYTDLFFFPPARIISLGASQLPAQFGNNRTGIAFQRLSFHVAFPPWLFLSPWWHLFVYLCLRGKRTYLRIWVVCTIFRMKTQYVIY